MTRPRHKIVAGGIRAIDNAFKIFGWKLAKTTANDSSNTLAEVAGARSTIKIVPALKGGLFFVPASALLVGMGEAQHDFLAEGFAQNLQANG